jgi:hypothetical protein
MNEMTAVTHGSNAPLPPAPLSSAEIDAYLDYALAQLIERRDTLVAALQATVTAIPVINDDDTLGDVGENMRMALALRRTGEDRRKEHKEPFLLGGRTVDAWFKSFDRPLTLPMAAVQAIMDDYGARKLAAARLKAEAEAKRLQDEADRAAAAAAKALDKGKTADTLLDRAAEAAKQADAAEAVASGKAAGLTRARGTFGATMSMRTTWGYEADVNEVPRHYLMVDDDAIKAAMKARDAAGRPTAVIPGVKWIPTNKMGVR